MPIVTFIPFFNATTSVIGQVILAIRKYIIENGELHSGKKVVAYMVGKLGTKKAEKMRRLDKTIIKLIHVLRIQV